MHPYMTEQLAAGRAAEAMRRAEAARIAGRTTVTKSTDAAAKDRSASPLLGIAHRISEWRATRRPIAVPAPASRPVDCCY